MSTLTRDKVYSLALIGSRTKTGGIVLRAGSTSISVTRRQREQSDWRRTGTEHTKVGAEST